MTKAKARRPAGTRLAPMKVSGAFRSFVLDQLEDLGDVTARSMFGGVGLYHRGIFFAILAADVLYLKVDVTNRPDYERAGMQPFKPYPNRAGTMQYYAVPLDVLESGIELTEWARKAIAVGARGPQPPATSHQPPAIDVTVSTSAGAPPLHPRLCA